MKSVLTPLPKSILMPVGLSAAIDAAIQKKKDNHGSETTALIISNEEMKDEAKIAESLEGSGLLIKGLSETIKNEKKEQKGGSLSMLLGTLASSILGNVLPGRGVICAGEGVKKSRSTFLVPCYPLTNF